MDLVSFHVALVAVIVLCFAGLSLDRYYRRRLRDALHETLAFKRDLRASQQETQEAIRSALDFHRLLVGTRVAYDVEAALCRVELQHQLYEQLHAQAQRHDDNEMRLLTEIGTDAIKLARISRVTEAWKAYALGYEVLCEAVHDEEVAGIENAQSAITTARNTLNLLGVYDA